MWRNPYLYVKTSSERRIEGQRYTEERYHPVRFPEKRETVILQMVVMPNGRKLLEETNGNVKKFFNVPEVPTEG